MNDYFISRLPAGHPVKDFKAAATVALRNEGTMVAPPEAAVPALRRQCAALEWVRSEVFTLDNVEKTPAPEHGFLLKHFGLADGGASKVQAAP